MLNLKSRLNSQSRTYANQAKRMLTSGHSYKATSEATGITEYTLRKMVHLYGWQSLIDERRHHDHFMTLLFRSFSGAQDHMLNCERCRQRINEPNEF